MVTYVPSSHHWRPAGKNNFCDLNMNDANFSGCNNSLYGSGNMESSTQENALAVCSQEFSEYLSYLLSDDE